jgi:hypothetical protein
MNLRTFWLNLGWLVVLVATVAAVLGLDAMGRLTYFASLIFWGLPLLYLWPVFRSLTASGTGRRRRALRWSAGLIAVLGVVLDLVLGHLTFRFPGCDLPRGQSPYVWCVPGLGGLIPIEELLFYVLGPIVIVLVYACADERWVARYHSGDDRLDHALIQVSPRLIAVAAALAVAALVLWSVNGTFPTYYAFLSAGALVPALFFYRAIAHLTNWQAVAVTTLYVLLTSVIWEVTLAIPRVWWGYEPSGMIGVTIAAWSRGEAIFPLEAAVVWLTAPFSCILIYEFARAFFHHERSTGEALFGPGAEHETPNAER